MAKVNKAKTSHYIYLGAPGLVVESGVSNTPQGTLRTVAYGLLRQQVQGESVPNKCPDVSERPSFITPHPPHDWLHVSNLFVVYD